jgi:hypothetical protein
VISETFDAERWDALCPATSVQGSRWIAAMLSRLPGRPLMAVTEGADGGVGFVGAVVEHADAYEAYNPWRILRGPEPVFAEVYAAGRPVAPHLGAAPEAMLPSAVLVAPGYLGDPVGPGGGRVAEVQACLGRICAWAWSAGLATVAVLYTTPAGSAVVEPAVAALGGESFDLTVRSVHPVRWRDGAEFLAAIGGRRTEVRRQLRALDGLGATVGTVELADHVDGVIEARCELLRRYGQPVDEAGERRRLRLLMATFGPDLLLWATERDAALVACALFLAQDRVLRNIYAGTTRQGRATPYAHLAATYHAPMRDVGCDRFDLIDYGIGHWDTKRFQGCTAVPLRGHLISPAPAGGSPM